MEHERPEDSQSRGTTGFLLDLIDAANEPGDETTLPFGMFWGVFQESKPFDDCEFRSAFAGSHPESLAAVDATGAHDGIPVPPCRSG